MARSSRQGAIPSDLGGLIDTLEDILDRLRKLEAPSGEALASTVARAEAQWTNAQIAAQINAAIAAAFAGNVSITGSLTVNGALAAASVSTAGTLTVGGAVAMPAVRTTSIINEANRAAVSVAGNGKLGTTA